MLICYFFAAFFEPFGIWATRWLPRVDERKVNIALIFFHFSIGLVKQFFSVNDGHRSVWYRFNLCGAISSARVLFRPVGRYGSWYLSRGSSLVDFIVRAAGGRDLGQMGDADDFLSVGCPISCMLCCHLLDDAAGDAGICFRRK